MNFNFDGVNIALQVDLSQNASLINQDGIQLVHWFQEQAINLNLCVDSQGCRRWVPVSKTAMSLSQIKINSGLCTGIPLYENSTMCRPESQLIEFSVGEYLQFKQRFLSVSILGFENCQSFFPTTAHVGEGRTKWAP